MQRTQESAAFLAQRWSLSVQTDERIIETSIGSFQGRRFEDLPKPYITEEGAHPELEGAASMRTRFMDWVEDVRSCYPDQVIAAVSQNGLALRCADYSLRADRGVLLAAVSQATLLLDVLVGAPTCMLYFGLIIDDI